MQSLGEMLVFGDMAVPLLREGMQVKSGDTSEPAELVIAPHSPVGGCALRPNPKGKAAFLRCDRGSIESTIFARPPVFPCDEGFQHSQSTDPPDHPDRSLWRWRGVGE